MDRLIIEEHAASLYLMDVGELEDEACFWRNYSSVSPARRAKIDSFRFMKDKRLSLGAGMLLARGLSDHGLAGGGARLRGKRKAVSGGCAAALL